MRDYQSNATLLRQFSYSYDAANRRFRISEDGKTIYLAYDGRNPVLKQDQSGVVLARRLYGRGVDRIVADEADGQKRWFLLDQVNSARDLVADDASLLNRYVYSSFGELLQQLDADVQNDIRYGAREFSRVSRFGYYRARVYDPTVGRFISADALFPYRYDYAMDNPLLVTDATGKSAEIIVYAALTVVTLLIVCKLAVVHTGVEIVEATGWKQMWERRAEDPYAPFPPYAAEQVREWERTIEALEAEKAKDESICDLLDALMPG